MNADNSISFQSSLAWEAVPPVYQLKLELQLELHASWRLSSDGMAKERRTDDADVGHVIFVIKDIEGIEMETAHSAIDRPSPAPPAARVRPLSTRSNRSKIRWRCSIGIPEPLS